MAVKRDEADAAPLLERPAEAVQSDEKTPRRKGAFEGWQAGAIIVGCAVITAVVVVPRPVEPAEIPTPTVDWEQVGRERAEEARRVTLAGTETLPYEVRAVGEGLRQLGTAEASRDGVALSAAKRDVELALRAWVTKYDTEPLLRLRALQAELFVRALRRWETQPAEAIAVVQELGGNFVELAKSSGWLDERGAFAGKDDVLRLLFRLRFGKVLGLDKYPFAPTLNDTRLYYRFRLERLSAVSREEDATQLAERAKLVSLLGEADSAYPTQVGLGVIAYRLGKYEEAAQLFDAYRTAHPNGPWSLRVQNHLAASLAAQE